MDAELIKCNNCVRAILIETGYSNWTVEGVTVACSKSLNPDAPFDNWYGNDGKALYAIGCDSFKYGDPVKIDVDTEDVNRNTSDLEIKWQHYTNGYVTAEEIENNY